MKGTLANLVFVSLLLSSLWSCEKQAEPAFRMEYSMTFEVKSGLNPFFKYIQSFQGIQSQLEANLKARNLDTSDVLEILPYDIRLVSVGNREVNYGIMNEIKVIIREPKTNGRNIEIAYVRPRLAEKNNGIRLLPGVANVTSYLKADQFDVEVELTFRELSRYSEQILFLDFAVYLK